MTQVHARAPQQKPLRWRELTDEQRWERIYKDRTLRKANRINSVRTAVWLALPCYAMQDAIADCHATNTGYIRADAHHTVVAGLALVAHRLIPTERKLLANRLERTYAPLKRTGFFTDNREFLYAVAAATVKLADEWRYPPDGPATLAALVMKEDAEDDGDGNQWGLSRAHAMQQASRVYDAFIETGLYPAIGG